MTDLMNYATELADELSGIESRKLPPVAQWKPTKLGDIDIVIKRDGAWFHDGEPIKRARLVRAFSTLLLKDADEYFLVTPYEKLRIEVEDAPLVAVQLEQRTSDENQVLSFTTNLGDRIEASAKNPIRYEANENPHGAAPYIYVRNGFEARIATSVFYEMVELVEERQIGGQIALGLLSHGDFFLLGNKAEIDAS